MSGVAGQSGNQGYASWGGSDISELTHWTFDKDYGVHAYNARSGGGWQKTTQGNKKITGTLTGKYTPADDIRATLDGTALVALSLYLDSGNYWSGNARVRNFKMSSNIDTGEPQEWSGDFESDGSWTYT